MTRTKLAAVFALALCLAPCAAQENGAASNRAKDFRQARRVRAEAGPERAAFEFEADGFSYHVSANGNGRRTKGDRTRRFNLRLDGRDFIEGFYFAVHEGDLLLVCGVRDAEAGAGLVVRLEQPSMRSLWRQHVPALNVGEPLRAGHDLYLTGADFVARLDLRTGEYVWQHEDLRDDADAALGAVAPGDFDSFEVPELSGDAVLFRGRAVYNRRRTLVVNRKTGKVIRVE
jgi:hypothetical protein